MDLERVFSVASAIAAVGWLFLIVVPKRPLPLHVAGVFFPLLLALMYLYFIAMHIRGADGGFGSLADVAMLFQRRELLLAGWIHYLCFDLFIGSWEVRDSQRNGIHVIDLDQTLGYLGEALEFVKQTTAGGGKILFVGTKKQAQEVTAAEAARSPSAR